jgi:hypothetical protein
VSDLHLAELIAGILLFVILPVEWIRMRQIQRHERELKEGEKEREEVE